VQEPHGYRARVVTKTLQDGGKQADVKEEAKAKETGNNCIQVGQVGLLRLERERLLVLEQKTFLNRNTKPIAQISITIL